MLFKIFISFLTLVAVTSQEQPKNETGTSVDPFENLYNYDGNYEYGSQQNDTGCWVWDY